MQHLECPRCGKHHVRRSHRRSVERVLSVLGLYPYRCEDCQHRFLALAPRKPPAS